MQIKFEIIHPDDTQGEKVVLEIDGNPKSIGRIEVRRVSDSKVQPPADETEYAIELADVKFE